MYFFLSPILFLSLKPLSSLHSSLSFLLFSLHLAHLPTPLLLPSLSISTSIFTFHLPSYAPLHPFHPFLSILFLLFLLLLPPLHVLQGEIVVPIVLFTVHKERQSRPNTLYYHLHLFHLHHKSLTPFSHHTNNFPLLLSTSSLTPFAITHAPHIFHPAFHFSTPIYLFSAKSQTRLLAH